VSIIYDPLTFVNCFFDNFVSLFFSRASIRAESEDTLQTAKQPQS